MMVNSNNVRDGGENKSIAVAVGNNKCSQHALKWAIDHLTTRDHVIKLVHVQVLHQRSQSSTPIPRSNNALVERRPDPRTMEMLLPFRTYCTRKQVQSEIALLEDHDVAKALIEYVTVCGIKSLLLGAQSRHGLSRLFKASGIAASVLKWTPDFCNVYIISKGKVSAVRNALRCPPSISMVDMSHLDNNEAQNETSGGSVPNNRLYDEFSVPDLDISFVSSGRTSTDSMFLPFYENFDHGFNQGCSKNRGIGVENSKIDDFEIMQEFASSPQNNEGTYALSKKVEEMEVEMRRLKVELKHTMDMYHKACKEAMAAKQKAIELQNWKRKDEKKIEEAQLTEQAAMEIMEKEKEKEKYKAALEMAEEAQIHAQAEMQKRINSERKALSKAIEKQKMLETLGQSHVVLKYQSLFHMLAVLLLFYLYFSLFN